MCEVGFADDALEDELVPEVEVLPPAAVVVVVVGARGDVGEGTGDG